MILNRPDRDFATGEQQQAVLATESSPLNRLSLAVDNAERLVDVERSEGDDERWQADTAHERAVEVAPSETGKQIRRAAPGIGGAPCHGHELRDDQM